MRLFEFELSRSALSRAFFCSMVALSSGALADDAVVQVARQRYKDGVAALDAGRYDEARAAFLQAYALQRHPAVLLNLGHSELKAGHPVEAGNHLQTFLREFGGATPEQKQTALDDIATARKQASTLKITVDVAGAQISVNGQVVGQSPMADPVFVLPGVQTIVVTKGDRSATTSTETRKGQEGSAVLSIGESGAPAVPVVPPTEPAPGPTEPSPVAPAPTPTPAPPPPRPAPAVEANSASFFSWYASHPIAWGLTALGAGGLGVGVAFTVRAAGASATADDHANQIQAEWENDSAYDPNLAPCSDDSPENDRPRFREPCATLRDDLDTYDSSIPPAVIGFSVGGAAIVGTVVYYLLSRDDESHAAQRWHLTPSVGPGHASGNFTLAF